MHASIRVRLLAVFLVVAVAAAAGLALYSLSELEGYALRKLEERLETEGRVVGALIASVYEEAGATAGTPALPAVGRDVGTRVIGRALRAVGPAVSSRIRVLDASGKVTADSATTDTAGQLFGSRREVREALAGGYGAATRVAADGRVALYVAVPIVVGGRVVGAAYASATTFSIVTLIRAYRAKLAGLVALYLLVAALVTELLARWLSRPLSNLEAGVARFAAGDHAVRVTPSGARETRAVAAGFNELADEVEHLVAELRAEERRKSRFVSDVSHEIRTPLTAIRGAAETLMQPDVPGGERHRFLGTIVSEADRLTRLANDLMTLQRIEGATGEERFGRVEIGDVVGRAAEALAPVLAERGVGVEVQGDAPAVLGDADRLQQVVANLLDNASRASTAGVVVRVELGADNRRAVVRVTDRGPGIPPDDLPSIFDRFYRSEASRDRATGGAGLGLAIVKAIVDAHGGTVEAANLPEGGAVFTVRLPALRAVT